LAPDCPENPDGRFAKGAVSFRKIAYGSLLAAALLTFLHLAAPDLNIVTKFVLPLPLAMIYILFGASAGLVLLSGCSVALFAFASVEHAISFVADGAVLAVLLGEYLKRGTTPTRTIAIGVLCISVIVTAGVLLTTPEIFDGDSEAGLSRLFNKGDESDREPALQPLKDSLGEEDAAKLLNYMVLSLPSLIAMGAFLQTLLVFLAFRVLVKRIFGEAQAGEHLTERFTLWHAPDILVFGILLSAALALLFDGSIFQISLNCLIILGAVYCIQGMAIALFYLQRIKVPQSLRWITVIVVLVGFGRYGSFLMYAAMGIMDVFFDFRKIRQRHSPQAQEDK